MTEVLGEDFGDKSVREGVLRLLEVIIIIIIIYFLGF